jgi:hypothetical protein
MKLPPEADPVPKAPDAPLLNSSLFDVADQGVVNVVTRK